MELTTTACIALGFFHQSGVSFACLTTKYAGRDSIYLMQSHLPERFSMRSSAPLLERSASCRSRLRKISPRRLEGRVVGLSGLVVDIDGLSSHVSVGDRLSLETRDGQEIPAE